MKLCMQCGINEKQKRCKICKPCAEINAAKRDAEFLARQRAKTLASATFRPCECGCGLTVRAPRKFAIECGKSRRNQASLAAHRNPTQAKIEKEKAKIEIASGIEARRRLLDRQQTLIDEEIQRREAEKIDRIHADMGLFKREWRQLAGDVRVLTPEEIAAILPTIKPPTGTGKRRPQVDPDKDFYQFNAGSIEPRTLRPYSADKCRGG